MEASITLVHKIDNAEGVERAAMGKGFADTRISVAADGTVTVTFILSDELEAAYLTEAASLLGSRALPL